MSRHASPHSPHRRAELAACQDVCALYHELNTSDRGLADDQVVLMRRQHGVNRLERERDTLPRCLARAFLNPFNLILIVLGVISLATDAALSSSYAHHVTTAAVIFVMVAVSGAVRLIEELRAKKAADQLGRLVRENVTVRRGGTLIEIPAEELVVGDLVTLSAGERVPADMRLVRSKDLFVSQAAITGESAAAEKHATSCAAGSTMPLTHCENLVFMATTVVGGDAEGIVVAVGADTLYGGLAGGDSVRGSFLAGTASIARVLVRFMVVLVPLIFVLIGVTGGNWLEAFVFALAVAVGLVPELLPMVVTACLAKGSLAMGRARVIVKNIDAMQGFGSIDVLCLDKTGTLTNESILLEYYLDVLGNEDARVLGAAFLNSSYHTGACNPIDNAILACETMPGRGTHFQELLAEHPKLDEIPFDHERRLTSALATRGDATVLIAKGDVESVVSRCSQVRHKDTLIPVSAGWEADVSAVVDEMRADGMKVIAVAERNLDARTTITPDDERDLTLIGYLAFFDAPKRTARASVEGLARLEVTPKVLTGDHADVATSICRRVGIPTDVVVRGAEIDAMDDAALTAAVERAHVFAELTPAHKARIVTSLRASGHIVGFLGDGLNDVPVLLAADVGISVDTAVDAAKDAADVVLLEKDLGVLERGILEGRKTFANILKYIKITASSNFGNILSIVCAGAFLPFLPMASVQILLLNLLYDILCIVLPWDNVDEDQTSAPRDWSGATLGRFMLSFGPISSLFDLATFLFLYFVFCPALCGAPYLELSDAASQAHFVALFQTGWFLESMWTQVLILHFLRTSKLPFVQSRPSAPVVLITVLGTAAFTALTFTPAAALVGLTQLPMGYFAFLFVVIVLYMVLTTVAKYRYQNTYHELI